jgi:hypothetical protein
MLFHPFQYVRHLDEQIELIQPGGKRGFAQGVMHGAGGSIVGRVDPLVGVLGELLLS